MRNISRLYLWLVYGVLYLPMAVLAAASFNGSRYGSRWEGPTFHWYRNLANDEGLMDAARNSLTVALLAATLATLIGSVGAIELHRHRHSERTFLQGLLLVTLMSPDIVMGVSLLVLFITLHIQLGFWSLLLAHITFCLPFVTITLLSRLRDFDQRLIEVAHDLGASEWQALRHIMVPLMLPAIAGGWLLSFTLSLDDVVVSFFVTGPTFEVLPLRIYSMIRLGVKPEVNAMATLLFSVSLLMVMASQPLLRKYR